MRLKSLICALLVMAVPVSAMAEEEAKTSKKNDDPREVGAWTYGVKGGLTLGKMHGSWVRARTVGASAKRSPHQGVSLGGFATWYLNSELAIQPEFYMTEKGVDFSDDAIETSDSEGLIYLELPVLAKYSFPIDDMIHAYAIGGLSVGYLVDSKLNERDDLKKFELSGVVGLGGDIKLGTHLVILELRFNEGFLNTLDLQDAEVANQKAKTRLISFLLGFST